MIDIATMLKQAIAENASDIHVAVGRPPIMRIDGQLIEIENCESLVPEQCKNLIYSILTDEQKEKFERNKELDFSLSISGLSRFRVNLHYQRGTVGASLRNIPNDIISLEELNLPAILKDLARLNSGLVLVTGPTGSGKSTTLAAMIDMINTEKACHIITVEDPIEFLHRHKQALVEQREVNADTDSFSNALKYVLRQDPDVILIGEMRDLETISAAVTAAETGHLVFATLHTMDVAQTIDRIIDVFPPHQQQQIRLQLANVIQGVVSQKLLPMASGRGRVAAVEIMIATPAIRALIRENKTPQLFTAIETGFQHGMQTMDRALGELWARGKISKDEAVSKGTKPEEVKRYYTQAGGM